MIETEQQLEDLLSRPSESDIAAAAKLDGDLLVLGAGGKMGPSLVRRAKRAIDAARAPAKVIAVARFTNTALATDLTREGIEVISADLLDREHVRNLPDAANVVFMAGRKFGSEGNEPLTWAVNAWMPGLISERFAASKIVAFSTGNVYPFAPASSGGAVESTPPAPVGEYAQSALARERIFQHFSNAHGTRIAILRLNYAIDLRYGVLLDIGRKVFERRPVDLRMGYVNIIWQGDANSICFRAFALCDTPPFVLNVTGPGTLPVRRIAEEFGRLFGIEPLFAGEEADSALLSNASLCHRLMGPGLGPDEMIPLTADWIRRGGVTWDKPTHFESRDGKF